jgi:hypothetical protein
MSSQTQSVILTPSPSRGKDPVNHSHPDPERVKRVEGEGSRWVIGVILSFAKDPVNHSHPDPERVKRVEGEESRSPPTN